MCIEASNIYIETLYTTPYIRSRSAYIIKVKRYPKTDGQWTNNQHMDIRTARSRRDENYTNHKKSTTAEYNPS